MTNQEVECRRCGYIMLTISMGVEGIISLACGDCGCHHEFFVTPDEHSNYSFLDSILIKTGPDDVCI